MSRPIWQWSACDITIAIKKGDISCLEVTNAVIKRMQSTNQGVNAVVVDQSEQAILRAKEQDKQRQIIPAQSLGPLFGVPLTIKDNLDQQGYANANGIAAFNHKKVSENAPVTDNLLKAGANIIGRTNAPEFSIRWQTDNPLYGLTLNPWNKNITCGGSSGGAAVATLMGYGPIAHGNDIGGSLRCPSYCCGTTTIRPSLGRVPAYNASSAEERPFVSQMLSVQGAIAREVKDVRLATMAMSQRDIRDPFWQPVPFQGASNHGPIPEPIKVAFTRNSYGLDIHPQVLEAIDKAAIALQNAGYQLEEVELPEVLATNELWRNLLFTDFKVFSSANIMQYGSDTIQQIMEGYYSISKILNQEEFANALSERHRILRQWRIFQEQYQLVLTPLMLQPAFPVGEDALNHKRTAETLMSYLYMSNVNLLGLPAATISTHLYQGVPIGVQIIGQAFGEDMCLDASQVIENAQGIMAHKFWDYQKVNV